MTLEEAIRKYKLKVEVTRDLAEKFDQDNYKSMHETYKQLVEWLMELKKYRSEDDGK